MKKKKIRRTASLLESNEIRLLEAYSESGRTCNIAAFTGDMIVLGLEVHKELERRKYIALAKLAGKEPPTSKCKIISFEYRNFEYPDNYKDGATNA